ncbi:MAG TPA: flagellar hook-basal body complex protein [Verrucomicrobiae bacterium]
MLLSLDSGVSALESFQQQLNVIANNIANVNTVGYKTADVSFADTLSETLGSNAVGPAQVGTGVAVAGINNNFATGELTNTGVQTDLAINGNGFFLVRDPVSGNTYATQDGEFTVDGNGYLVTNSGMRVQGYSDSGLSSLGDIKIDNNGNTAALQSFTIGPNGKINVLLADGTTLTRGQILLQNFGNPQQLVKAGGNLYAGLSLASPLANPVAPGSNGLGTIASGSLEMSNVDLARELTSLITTQRAYEANSKVISTSDDVLQTLVNLKR